jgi:hypothetical protein
VSEDFESTIFEQPVEVYRSEIDEMPGHVKPVPSFSQYSKLPRCCVRHLNN